MRRELLIAARHILATEMRNSEGVGGARVGKEREKNITRVGVEGNRGEEAEVKGMWQYKS